MRALRIILGVALVAAAYAFITVPMTIINGGVTSLSLILGSVSGIEMSFLVNGITLMILLLCGVFLGRSYLLASLLSCLAYLGFFSLFRACSLKTGLAFHGSMALAVVLAAVIVGLGYAFCISARSTILGFDTIAIILNHYYPGISVAKTMALINCAVVFFGFVVFSWKEVLAGIVFSLIQAKVLDLMLPSIKSTFEPS